MKIFIRSAAGLALLSLFAVAHASPPTVNPEQMDLDPEMQAKIMKEKSKRSSVGEAGGGAVGEKSGSKDDCGSVNINSNDKKSNSGIGQIMGKSTTTIVTGSIINMAKCK